MKDFNPHQFHEESEKRRHGGVNFNNLIRKPKRLKAKKVPVWYVCDDCGEEVRHMEGWQGNCPSCNSKNVWRETL